MQGVEFGIQNMPTKVDSKRSIDKQSGEKTEAPVGEAGKMAAAEQLSFEQQLKQRIEQQIEQQLEQQVELGSDEVVTALTTEGIMSQGLPYKSTHPETKTFSSGEALLSDGKVANVAQVQNTENSNIPASTETKEANTVRAVNGFDAHGLESEDKKLTNPKEVANKSTTGLEQVKQPEQELLHGEVPMESEFKVDSGPWKATELEPVEKRTQVNHQSVIDQMKDGIQKQVIQKAERFEIELTPKELGTIKITAQYDGDVTYLSITCYEADTLKILSQNASTLGSILEMNTGTETQVLVDEPPKDYTQEEGERQSQSHQGQEQEKKQQAKENQKVFLETIDFVQQLRLGLA